MMTTTSRVIFLPVGSSGEKINTLMRLCQDHFDKGLHLLIKSDCEESARFIDSLLWRADFLPHGIDSDELICITWQDTNPNGAHALLNLCEPPCDALNTSFLTIYELDDASKEARAEVSKKKYRFYREKGIRIAEISLK